MLLILHNFQLLEEFKIIDSEVIPVGREMSGIVTQGDHQLLSVKSIKC